MAMERKQIDDFPARVEVCSLGTADLDGLSSVARGLDVPMADLVARVWRSPAVLVDDLDRSTADRLAQVLQAVGLEVEVGVGASPLPEPELFDVAVQVSDPLRTDEVVRELSGALGVEPLRVYELLATPPGSILGKVGAASASALEARLGTGVRLLRAPSDQGPYDVYLEQGEAISARARRWLSSRLERGAGGADLARRSGGATGARRHDVDGSPLEGYLALGLDHAEAGELWTHLQSGGAGRVVPRGLVRFEVVLFRSVPASPERTAILDELFGIPPRIIPTVLESAPVSLAEGLTLEEARARVARTSGVGLPTRWEPMHFGRAGLRVERVEDPEEFDAVLTHLGLDPPDRIPALVAPDLSDFEARRLAATLSAAGARIRFTEPAAASGRAS